MFWSIGRDLAPGTLTYHDVRCDGTPQTSTSRWARRRCHCTSSSACWTTGDVSQPRPRRAGGASRCRPTTLRLASSRPALGASAASAGSASATISYLQCLELDGVGAPCADTVSRPSRGRRRDHPGRHAPRPRAPRRTGPSSRIVVDAVPTSLIYQPIRPRRAFVRASRPARQTPPTVRVALDGVLVPGDWTLRVRITATGKGSHDRRLVRRPDPHRALGRRRRMPPTGRPSASATLPVPWGYSSAGRAPAWHAGGPGFESP